jgi:hypothetical protein
MSAQSLTIARNAFVESLRQPAMLFLVIGSGVVQVLIPWMTGFAMGQEESGELEGDNKLQFDIGLSSVFVIATILAAFIATTTLSREIENKTALTVVSKPIGRPTVVVGKYLGVSAALLIALGSMIIFLLVSVRHGVLSNASDQLDMPAIVFPLAAVLISLVASGWLNFFYGWNFPQTSVSMLFPLLIVAFGLVMAFDKTWASQEWFHDFKPQVTVAALALTLAVLVLTSIAVAASTRLSQVMTVFVCLGVFLASLLTNHFLGRFAFSNSPIGIVASAEPTDLTRGAFDRSGDMYTIELIRPPNEPLKPGTPIYYGINGNGFDLVASKYEPFTGDASKSEDTLGINAPAAIIVTSATEKSITIRNIGYEGVPVSRPPQPRDYFFTQPTKANAFAMVPWSVLPNMHYFWLLDAVSQNQPVPVSYLARAAIYAAFQVGAFLSLAVILFQKRDVG